MIGMGEGRRWRTGSRTRSTRPSTPRCIDVDITGANGVLVNVTGGEDMSIGDAQKVAEMIQAKVSPQRQDHLGCIGRPGPGEQIRVMVVITGVKSKNILGPKESRSVKAMNVDFIK